MPRDGADSQVLTTVSADAGTIGAMLIDPRKLVRDWLALPENERSAFAAAIAARAEQWREPHRPALWPIVVRVERDDPDAG